jgi:hypothetical protein
MSINPQAAYEVAYAPIPDTSQVIALSCPCKEILYHGTRGPGKTATQLMRFAKRVGMGFGNFWRGVIFAREYNAFNDLIIQSKRFFNRIWGKTCRFYESKGAYHWEWDTGEVLEFRVMKRAEHYWNNFHGQEYPFIAWHELCNWPTSELYDLCMSCLRSGWNAVRGTSNFPDIDIPLETFSTTNSKGSGHRWVKRYFIDVAPAGVPYKENIEVLDPKTKEYVTVTVTRVHIFGSFVENIYLSPEYIAGLVKQCRHNEALRKSWLEGSWDIPEGGAFDDLWKSNVHVVPRFPVPKEWYLDRSMDWGSTRPFSVGWWCVSNGEEIVVNGEKRSFYPGSLIQCAEWYGAVELGKNKGIRLASGKFAQGVIQREVAMMALHHFTKQPKPGPADNSIGKTDDAEFETTRQAMAKIGVKWSDSDKRPGSRGISMQLFRDRLENSLTNEGAGIYFMENCPASIGTIPYLPRDVDDMGEELDDIDTDAEDHAYDMMRYRLLASGQHKVLTKPVKFKFAN